MAKPKPQNRDPVESVWAGVPRFECPVCGWDSLDAPKVVEHVRLVHPVADDPTAAYSWTLTQPATAATVAVVEPEKEG